jgi:hypothetical protein
MSFLPCTYRLIQLSLCVVLALSSHVQSAAAQDIPSLGRKDKTPADYAYSPIHYKGLIIAPKLTWSNFYNDNIYATSSDEKSDYIVSLTPSLNITKDYGSSTFTANISGTLERYKTYTEENRAGYLAALSYKNEITSQLEVFAGSTYQSQARRREDPTGLAAASEPLYIDTFSLKSGLLRRFNRLSLTLQGEYDSITNDNGVSRIDPSVPVNFSQNDRDQYTGTAILQYDLVPGGDLGSSPEKAIYLKTSMARHDYEEQPATTISRDRERITALFGFLGNFKSLNLITDLSVGTTMQDFDDGTIEETTDLSYFAKIQYQPSEKHSLFLEGSREVTADSLFIEGITETNFNLNSNYEIQHNLYLDSRIGYEINDFETGREDKDTIGGLALRYLLSPRLESKIGATYTDRDSSAHAESFDQTVFMLQLIGRL